MLSEAHNDTKQNLLHIHANSIDFPRKRIFLFMHKNMKEREKLHFSIISLGHHSLDSNCTFQLFPWVTTGTRR
uniref:Uncharacterized protein n=1 Tax=Monodelphis domestica TaxID=13616 RepID=A0A5F8HFS5_MONDO